MLTLRGVEMITECELGNPFENPMFDHHVKNFMNVVRDAHIGQHMVIFIDHDRGDVKMELIEVTEE